MPQYFGKYPGIVDQNIDPHARGRLLVKVPGLFEGSVWALPSVPYAGPDIGFFAMPPTKAHVWVEFAGGDPTVAIWSGCYWGDNESAPVSFSPLAPNKKVLKTGSCTITLDDTPVSGGIKIEYSQMKIEMTTQSIQITDGLKGVIEIQGPTVKINDGALEVT
jgi:hypothetical protein